MKIAFILAMLTLLSVASAETIQFGNYTATFDMKQPHIIDNNNNNTILTYYGGVNIGTFNNPIDRSNKHYVGDLQEKNLTCALYYFPEQPDYFGVIFANKIERLPIASMESTMNLTSTLDFLKSLKIEKTRAA